MSFNKTLSAVALAASALAAAPAHALDFYYSGNLVATLTTANSTDFTFKFLWAPDSGAFINDLLLDIGNGAFKNTTAGSVTTPSYSFDEGGYEGTGLQSKVSFPTANTPSRFTIGEEATWSIAGDFGGMSRAHINAFIDGKSIKITSVVPEPEAYGLALAGMLIVGFAMRRKA